MAPVTIFASTQACPAVLDQALNLRQQGHYLLPTSLLPAPLPARVASLRIELSQLQQDERTISWTLSQYAEHRRLPDACRENGLKADLDATRSRLRAVQATLRAVAGQQQQGGKVAL